MSSPIESTTCSRPEVAGRVREELAQVDYRGGVLLAEDDVAVDRHHVRREEDVRVVLHRPVVLRRITSGNGLTGFTFADRVRGQAR